ncbi:S1 family peptidase [Streptomyces sp. NPDC059578]|uniref:S1 family peptidase n=1 Tax=Streptomyces sp. NPDC059578 TaxID=3346874 RepID=UPI0036AD0856
MSSSTRSAATVLAASALMAAGLTVTAAPASAIHGGKNATTGTHPYAMQLRTAGGQHVCGGTLVAPTKVLTAAHCVKDVDAARQLKVIGGRTNLAGTNGTVRGVADVTLHPQYDGFLGRDAAVLTLSARMPYRSLPVAGPRDNALYALGKTATAVGWGQTARDTSATRLKSAVLKLASIKTCEPFTGPTDTRALTVCGAPTASTKDSTCRGDSGGPLIAGGKVIGIVSTGNKYCDDVHPDSVFTRVSAVAADLGLSTS